MAPIITTADIDRPVADVFAYATDPFRFTEWQQGVVDGHMDGPQLPSVGAKCTMTRRIGGADRSSTSVNHLVGLDRRVALPGASTSALECVRPVAG